MYLLWQGTRIYSMRGHRGLAGAKNILNLDLRRLILEHARVHESDLSLMSFKRSWKGWSLSFHPQLSTARAFCWTPYSELIRRCDVSCFSERREPRRTRRWLVRNLFCLLHTAYDPSSPHSIIENTPRGNILIHQAFEETIAG